MNENLDLTKILDGCPGGTLFYSTIYGDVYFIRVYPTAIYPSMDDYPIELVSCTKALKMHTKVWVTKEGLDKYNFDGECTLFPSKDQRDWSKFERFWDKPKIGLDIFEPFDKVLVRNRETELWLLDMFAFHVTKNVVKTLNGAYMQCIPYNEETKRLLGTNNDCPEYYKWWEE